MALIRLSNTSTQAMRYRQVVARLKERSLDAYRQDKVIFFNSVEEDCASEHSRLNRASRSPIERA